MIAWGIRRIASRRRTRSGVRLALALAIIRDSGKASIEISYYSVTDLCQSVLEAVPKSRGAVVLH